MSYNWNWGIFFQLSPDGTYTYVQLLLFGAGWTLATSLLVGDRPFGRCGRPGDAHLARPLAGAAR